MFIFKKHENGKIDKRFLYCFTTLIFSIFSISTIVFASSIITEQNIKDAVLGNSTFQESELNENGFKRGW